MRSRVIASTKVGYELPIEEAIEFSGKEAGICYMPDTVDEIFNEPTEKTMKRVMGNMASNHHSVFGHVRYNFVFEDIPKILAMFLNNEKVYDTSEKSARFTKMKPSKDEKELYEKWIEIFKIRIHELYPDIKERQLGRLAQENARYLISVFTPATVMGYSVTFQQFSYILHFMEDYIQKEEDTEFNKLLKPYLQEFVDIHAKFKVEGINPDSKNRKLALFSKVRRKEEWGENYCCNYLATFSQEAQGMRHRTTKNEIYEYSLYSNLFFTPPCIRGTALEEKWLDDIRSLSKNFPQGKLVLVNERGSVEDFVQKCKERLCGCAQLEIALQTKRTLEEYLRNTKETDERVYNYLLQYANGARCTFPDYTCNKPCIWGAKGAFERLV